MSNKPHILFAWPELPDYAARGIRGVIDAGFAKVSVIATKPSVPITGMEKSLGQPVTWIDAKDSMTNWAELPDIMFVGGYKIPAFNTLVRKCRDAGVPVVLMSDMNWQGNFRQRFLQPLRHRFLLRGYYSAVFVPGKAGVDFARHMGYAENVIRTGLYGGDKGVFSRGPDMESRSKTFLFVGQFIARKNVLGLIRAFHRFSNDHPEWTLRLCGSGPQKDEIEPHPRIFVENFVQPPELAKRFHDARAMILPSIEEHWSLVAIEAALSGCALGLTSVNGIALELATPENAVVYAPSSDAAIEDALRQFASWTEEQWQKAQEKSLDLAKDYGPQRFASEVEEFTRQLVA